MGAGYHHGHLREAVLARAAEIIAAEGPHALNLRSLAAEIGVSHTAPRHHFGSREGVLNALAAEGFRGLAEALGAVREAGGTFLDAGVAYVQYALEHRGHFAVMFATSLHDDGDPELIAARQAAYGELRRGVERLSQSIPVEDAAAATLAGWSIAHGFATLALTGNLDAANIRPLLADQDLVAVARRTIGMLYGSPSEPPPPATDVP